MDTRVQGTAPHDVGVRGYDQVRMVVDAVPGAILVSDASGRIVLANPEAERSFGYTHDELLSLTVENLLPERFRLGHADLRAAFALAPSRRQMGTGRELYARRKDGSELPVEIGLNPIVIDGEQHVIASVIDITERLRAQRLAEDARGDGIRRSVLDTIPVSTLVTDERGRILNANPAAQVLLGYERDELVGMSLNDIDGVGRDIYDDGSLLASGAEVEDYEWVYRHRSGELVPVQQAIVRLDPAATGGEAFLVVSYDITHRIETREHVEHLASHDALTNLPNRSLLLRHLETLLTDLPDDGRELVLILFDLDHFKRINDSLGHHVGDELLVAVADRLRAWTRRDDFVARLGGDEFVMVFRSVRLGEELDARLRELMADLLAPVVVDGYELAVTGSVGGARCPRDGVDAGELLKHADIAMYRAKASGRNELQWFEPHMMEENRDRLALSAALRQALDRPDLGELSVAYQPQLDLRTGEMVGVEALARWRSTTMGQVPPDTFVAVAEDGGMISRLGGWVLRTACADLALMQDRLDRKLRLAVNVSPRQMRGTAWLEEIAEALEHSGIAPEQLEVEITEGMLIEDHVDTVAMLTALRRLGVTIVVDDFGRGYSSLAYLTRFPIDKIKIDRSFVQAITAVEESAAIVDAIIVMAHALGMSVVAEGVETEVQERYLRKRGCDEVQGYRYSPGVPLRAVVEVAKRLDQA
ncbi:EAL domain-containing protein [Nocardioides sp. zg-ZUI104]|uniref:putative bifunctional diguanylate cyclase/phosphodiesterase n=1 Tax=Nocardioides faecalis TaxID=2803858 RepID=UPI001BCBCA54|nr:EAL domain-containing protein [Nocardioides faecalis]MBS4754655.1 EAL domain-containing protein [Nocardioides faecalis]